MTSWGHDPLAEDLAAHLWAGGKHLTWLNFAPMGWSNQARPDVYAIKRHNYSHPEVVSFEVKVSQSDLRSDLTSGKWQKYLEFSNGVTFAAPHGLCTKNDIPDGCGLILRSERGWRHVRRPTLKRLEIDAAIMLRLVNSPPSRSKVNAHSTDSWEIKHLVDRCKRQAISSALKEIGDRVGKHFAEAVARDLRGEDVIGKASAEADRIKGAAESDAQLYWDQLAEAVGLPPGRSGFEIGVAVRKTRERLLRDGELENLREALRKAKASLDKIDLPIDEKIKRDAA